MPSLRTAKYREYAEGKLGGSNARSVRRGDAMRRCPQQGANGAERDCLRTPQPRPGRLPSLRDWHSDGRAVRNNQPNRSQRTNRDFDTQAMTEPDEKKPVARCRCRPAMSAVLLARLGAGQSVAARYGFSSFFTSISLDSSLQDEAYIGSGENDKRYRRHHPASRHGRLAGTYP